MAAGFFLTWGIRRQSYLALPGVAFVVLAGALALQFFTLFGLLPSKIVSNFVMLVGGICICEGVLWRYDRKPPVIPLALTFTVKMAACAWFTFYVSQLNWRIPVVDHGFGTILLLCLVTLHGMRSRRPVEELGALASRADDAVYRAKGEGPDRVSTARAPALASPHNSLRAVHD